MCGKVYIVGAGPGDPDLITVKAMKILERADVVLYDRLINEEILKYAKNTKELVYVGKKIGEFYKQELINNILIEYAQKYDIVVRLKSGDPMIFGRSGEEMEALREAGIEYEVIPGISSALAAPTYAGIPVTHRDYASSLAIVTGHRKEGEEYNIKIGEIASVVDTLVILMGVSNLEEIIKRLKKYLPISTPIAIIMNSTLKNQKVIKSTIGDINKYIEKGEVHPSAVIVVGEVVELRERLKWFD